MQAFGRSRSSIAKCQVVHSLLTGRGEYVLENGYINTWRFLKALQQCWGHCIYLWEYSADDSAHVPYLGSRTFCWATFGMNCGHFGVVKLIFPRQALWIWISICEIMIRHTHFSSSPITHMRLEAKILKWGRMMGSFYLDGDILNGLILTLSICPCIQPIQQPLPELFV